MKTLQTNIPDCKVLEHDQFNDNRGVFIEFFKQSSLPYFDPQQTNYSYSFAGVFRGIHRTPYAKMVTCVLGSVYDICVDLRPESPQYNQYFGIELSDKNLKSLYIPPYCGHGFLALTDSVLIYHQDQEYDKALDEAFCYKDYGIIFPTNISTISLKDEASCGKSHLK